MPSTRVPLIHRSDGHLATDTHPYRRFMPALMPTRSESVVFIEQVVRVERAERYVAGVRAANPDVHATLFDVVLHALAKTLAAHPRINRFVAGGRLYERDDVVLSFTAKTTHDEGGSLVEVKRRFDPDQPFVDMVREVQLATGAARMERGATDKELALFLRLPPLLRRGVVRAATAANARNLLPRSFIDGDPFFASAFLTNLGSVGLDAAFHHLYEYGTIPIFCTLGLVHDGVVVDNGQPAVARVASIKFTYDERVEDGLYAGHALEDFRRMVEDPAAAWH